MERTWMVWLFMALFMLGLSACDSFGSRESGDDGGQGGGDRSHLLVPDFAPDLEAESPFQSDGVWAG